ncbi:MAG: leucyl aminopeptidase [Candidatus Marinimicrobia bacterium]|nr:leucyl aminopeptidase [Candidatus Neomarinimicrobiota bacterium]
MKISFAKISVLSKGTVIYGVPNGGKLGPAASKFDKRTRGSLSRAMKSASFKGEKEKSLVVLAPVGTRLDKVVLIGLGDVRDLRETAAERIGAIAYKIIAREPLATIVLDVPFSVGISAGVVASHIAGGVQLRSYRFNKYRTKEDKSEKPKLRSLVIQCDEPATAKASFASIRPVAEGIFFTRDLTSEPANIIYPASFSARTKDLEKDGVKVEILGETAMRKLGMGALLGVGDGSVRESQLVVMRWDGAKNKKTPPIVVVGKGVCFDTGGISLKPPGGMWDMKWDMGGAGVVAGLMRALAKRKAKANVVGLCGLVENMPDGAAQRPGDVVTSMSGQTIEVQNTDAEGRLVLADVLWYAQERFKPHTMIDLATLTGAVIAALSNHYAGLFANDDDLATQLTAAGQHVEERLWRFPMGEEYDKELRSLIADMKNIGGPKAGSITAAQFLQRFVKNTRWAHLDIAGVVWNEKGTILSEPGSTGFGVRLLNRFILDNCED